jgi:uncharacterized protein YggT (Ycf19 family)
VSTLPPSSDPVSPQPPPPRPVTVVEPRHEFHIGRAVLWTTRLLAYLILAYVIVVEVILVLGFFLRLFGANPSTPFVEFIYRSLDRVMEPFRGIFEPIQLGTAANDVAAVLDTSLLFAMIIYGLLLITLQAALRWLNLRIARMDEAV